MDFRSTLILVTILAGSPSLWAQSGDSVHWLTGENLLTRSDDISGVAENILYITPLAPELRPRLSVSVPQSTVLDHTRPPRLRPFSWSVEAWQLNTASLAHIQCNRATLTLDTYLAQDCRVVDRPLPEDSVNLVQVRGRWLATPGLALEFGAFRGQAESDPINQLMYGAGSTDPILGHGLATDLEGMDMSLSFGVQAGGLGDLLVDLQLSRYRQRNTGIPGWMSSMNDPTGSAYDYRNAAQLALGWRKGDFSGDLLGHYREHPVRRLPGSLPGPSFSSFDIEFSWRAPWNARFTVGASNVLDQAPAQEPAPNGGFDDPMEGIYGRIPYVRYKQDL